MFKCTMGLDVTKHSVKFWHNGTSRQTQFSFAVRECWAGVANRLQAFHVCMWPEIFQKLYITASERDLRRNFTEVRTFVLNIWLDRKSKKDPHSQDLISVMLQEPMFYENDEKAVNEILTILLAGTQTSANVTQNLLMYLCKHPEYKVRARASDDFY